MKNHKKEKKKNKYNNIYYNITIILLKNVAILLLYFIYINKIGGK